MSAAARAVAAQAALDAANGALRAARAELARLDRAEAAAYAAGQDRTAIYAARDAAWGAFRAAESAATDALAAFDAARDFAAAWERGEIIGRDQRGAELRRIVVQRGDSGYVPESPDGYRPAVWLGGTPDRYGLSAEDGRRPSRGEWYVLTDGTEARDGSRAGRMCTPATSATSDWYPFGAHYPDADPIYRTEWEAAQAWAGYDEWLLARTSAVPLVDGGNRAAKRAAKRAAYAAFAPERSAA